MQVLNINFNDKQIKLQLTKIKPCSIYTMFVNKGACFCKVKQSHMSI